MGGGGGGLGNRGQRVFEHQTNKSRSHRYDFFEDVKKFEKNTTPPKLIRFNETLKKPATATWKTTATYFHYRNFSKGFKNNHTPQSNPTLETSEEHVQMEYTKPAQNNALKT